jgi:hypothetical protein
MKVIHDPHCYGSWYRNISILGKTYDKVIAQFVQTSPADHKHDTVGYISFVDVETGKTIQSTPSGYQYEKIFGSTMIASKYTPSRDKTTWFFEVWDLNSFTIVNKIPFPPYPEPFVVSTKSEDHTQWFLYSYANPTIWKIYTLTQ